MSSNNDHDDAWDRFADAAGSMRGCLTSMYVVHTAEFQGMTGDVDTGELDGVAIIPVIDLAFMGQAMEGDGTPVLDDDGIPTITAVRVMLSLEAIEVFLEQVKAAHDQISQGVTNEEEDDAPRSSDT